MQITKTQFCFHFLPKVAFNKNKNNITKERNLYLNNYTKLKKLKEKKKCTKSVYERRHGLAVVFFASTTFNLLYKFINIHIYYNVPKKFENPQFVVKITDDV